MSRFQAPELVLTERLRLRPPVPADAQAIYSRYAQDAEVTHYMAWPRHHSADDSLRFVEFSQEQWRQRRVGAYLIERLNDGLLLGSTGLDVESDSIAATGYILAKDAWGLGYASETLQAMVRLARRLGLEQLYALCHPHNISSQRVLEKAGFNCDGLRHKAHVFPNYDVGKADALRYTRYLI